MAKTLTSHLDSYADPSSYLESEAPELSFVDPEESQPDAESTRIEDHEESSLHQPTPAETSSTFAVRYEIMENGSKRGQLKLFDS